MIHRAVRPLSVVIAAASLAGCTLTLPVTGLMGSTNETFAGSATGHMDGAGELELTMGNGATCHGQFVYVTGRQGSGTLKCFDGRSGTFNFVSTGQRGTGSGVLDGKPFTLTFGR
jgi:hypothetical protein